MDLKLVDYDMLIVDGDVQFVKGAEAVGQDVTMELRTFLSESKYDKSKGVPYREVIFQRGTEISVIEQILRQKVLSVTGVTSLKELSIDQIDYQSRNLSVSGTGTCVDGEFDFSGTFPTPI